VKGINMSATRPRKIGLPAHSRPRRPNGAIRLSGVVNDPTGVPRKILEPRLPQFLACSNDGERVVARGHSFEAARRAAHAKGEPDPIVEQAPNKARRA
jgi:hypothetical protein